MLDPTLICRRSKGLGFFYCVKPVLGKLSLMAMMGVTTSFTLKPCALYRCGAINTKTKESLLWTWGIFSIYKFTMVSINLLQILYTDLQKRGIPVARIPDIF